MSAAPHPPQPEQAARPITLDNHNDLSGSFMKFARTLANIQKPETEKTKSAPALFGLFGGRKAPNQEKR